MQRIYKGDELNIEKDGRKLKVRVIEVEIEEKDTILPSGYPIMVNSKLGTFNSISDKGEVVVDSLNMTLLYTLYNPTSVKIPEWDYDDEISPRNGWFPHTRSECPVHPQMEVEFYFYNNYTDTVVRDIGFAKQLDWHFGDATDIRFYRVISGQCLADFV